MSNPLAEALRGLPQFPRIRQDDAKRWLSHVIERNPARVLWLIGRLGDGFGGSEIGTLILDAQGRQGPFSSGPEVVNEKLMRILPSPTNKFMQKGTKLEEAVILSVLRLHGGELDRAHLAAFDLKHEKDLFGLAGNPDFPWATPEGRYLVDIKVPGSGEEKLHDLDKQLMYCAQLNTYNLINNARGLPAFDKLFNIHLELPPVVTDAMVQRLDQGGADALPGVVDDICALAKYDLPGMRLHFIEQPINPAMTFNGATRQMNDVICEVAAVNWQCVLDGRVPEINSRADYVLSDEERELLSQHADALLDLFALQAATQQRIAVCQEEITALCKSVNIEGDLSQTPHINIKQTSSVDIEYAVELCQRVGVDIETCRATREKMGVRDYDTLAMAEALQSLGQDMKPYIKPAPFDNDLLLQRIEDAGENPARLVSHHTSINRSQKKITHARIAELTSDFAEKLQPLIDDALIQRTNSEQPAISLVETLQR